MILFFLAGGLWASAALGQLRIVQYNTGIVKPGLATVLEQIGNESVNGIARPMDVMVVEEQSNAADVANLVATLNSIYGAGSYVAAPFAGTTAGGGLPAMVYRPASVSLITAPVGIGTVSTSGNARQTIKYQLRPAGYGADADLYVYASHFKASNTASDAARRNVEAATNRADADAMGPGKNILYIGDFNLYSGNESAFTTLTAPGNAQAVDPVHAPLNWSGNANRIYHTQSPATVAAYAGQITGGINDRFDFQLSSAAMNDGQGLAIIPGSYRAFGINGSQPLNGPINSASSTWNNSGLTVSRTAVLDALAIASDHIPVVVDYQLPAKMDVTSNPVPSNVIVGANVPVNVTVTNTAGVSVAIAADKLRYGVNGSGAITGSQQGTATATLAGNTHTLALATNSPGISSGTLSVTSTSQAVANGTFTVPVSTTVLGHAKPSLGNRSNVLTQTIDFGVRALGLPAPSIPFSIYNLSDSSGFTADLDVDGILASGQTAALSINASTFKNQPVGARNFAAFVDTNSVGSFSAGYEFLTSDADLPGAAVRDSLLLQLQGIVAIGGDANLDNKVDIYDLRQLVANWQSPGTWYQGDFNADGIVNRADLAMLAAGWQTNLGGSLAQALETSFTEVPEPATGIMLLTSSIIVMIPRWRR